MLKRNWQPKHAPEIPSVLLGPYNLPGALQWIYQTGTSGTDFVRDAQAPADRVVVLDQQKPASLSIMFSAWLFCLSLTTAEGLCPQKWRE